MFLTQVENARAVRLGQFRYVEGSRFFAVLALHLGILERAGSR